MHRRLCLLCAALLSLPLTDPTSTDGASLYGGSGGATARFRSLGPRAVAHCECVHLKERSSTHALRSAPYCWVSASDTSSTSAYCEHSPYCQTFGITYVECGSAGTCSASSTATLHCSNSGTCMAWSVEHVHCDNTQNCTINGEGSRYTEVSCGAAQSCGVAVNGGDADYSVSCQYGLIQIAALVLPTLSAFTGTLLAALSTPVAARVASQSTARPHSSARPSHRTSR